MQGTPEKLPKWMVTADDWGMSRGINEGILDLVERGVVRRVSILAQAPHVKHLLAPLAALSAKGRCSLGLHFSLAHLYTTPGRFLLRQTLWPVDPVWIKSAFRQQMSFLGQLGVSPVYVDGHHHVHVFPRVFSVVATEMRRHRLSHIRVPYDRRLYLSKRFIVHLLAAGTRDRATALGLTYLPFFYPQRRDWSSVDEMERLMETLPGGELITHPSLHSKHSKHVHPTHLGTNEVEDWDRNQERLALIEIGKRRAADFV